MGRTLLYYRLVLQILDADDFPDGADGGAIISTKLAALPAGSTGLMLPPLDIELRSPISVKTAGVRLVGSPGGRKTSWPVATRLIWALDPGGFRRVDDTVAYHLAVSASDVSIEDLLFAVHPGLQATAAIRCDTAAGGFSNLRVFRCWFVGGRLTDRTQDALAEGPGTTVDELGELMIGARLRLDQTDNEGTVLEDCVFTDVSVAGIVAESTQEPPAPVTAVATSFQGEKEANLDHIRTIEPLINGTVPTRQKEASGFCTTAEQQHDPSTDVSRYLRSGTSPLRRRQAIEDAWGHLHQGNDAVQAKAALWEATEVASAAFGDEANAAFDAVIDELATRDAPVTAVDLIPLRPGAVVVDGGRVVADSCSFNGITTAVSAGPQIGGSATLRDSDFEGSEHILAVAAAASRPFVIDGGRFSPGLPRYMSRPSGTTNQPAAEWSERAGPEWRNPGWLIHVVGPNTVTVRSAKIAVSAHHLNEDGEFAAHVSFRPGFFSTSILELHSAVIPFTTEPEYFDRWVLKGKDGEPTAAEIAELASLCGAGGEPIQNVLDILRGAKKDPDDTTRKRASDRPVDTVSDTAFVRHDSSWLSRLNTDLRGTVLSYGGMPARVRIYDSSGHKVCESCFKQRQASTRLADTCPRGCLWWPIFSWLEVIIDLWPRWWFPRLPPEPTPDPSPITRGPG